ncbi:MAG: four helix bundle protein [Bacteroidetes bacterium]|jgi:four helix bundle protein|nr:four helix bundle protein [Bacteroidota bacterium]MCA6442709.1 four helix bundle protein [Bacteroidota bacterium]
MEKSDLKIRTKAFAIETIRFLNTIPKSKANDVLTYQLVKSATSVAANYRSALRGRSTAEFISKLNIVLEESDESHLWFEIIEETNSSVNIQKLKTLKNESHELTAIFTSSLKTARNNYKSKNLTS